MSLPLTQRQTLMWLDAQVFPGAPFHNVVATVDVKGDLDPDRLNAAWKQTVADRDALRMVIDAQEPRQTATTLDLELPRVEVAGSEAMRAWIAEHCVRSYDSGARWEAALLRLASDHHVFYLSQDHLLTDGVSVVLVLENLESRYLGLPPALGASFADYVEAEALYQASPEARISQEYWRDRLAAPPPPIRLYGKSRTDPSLALESSWSELDSKTTSALLSLAKYPSFCSLSDPLSRLGIVATALTAFLYRASGQREVLIAIPIANRSARFASTCGLFMEQIFLRLEIEEGETYVSLAAKIRHDLLNGLRHGRACVSTRDISYVTLNMLPPLPTHFAKLHAQFNLRQAVSIPGVNITEKGDLRDTLGLRVLDFAEGPLRMAWDFHAGTFDSITQQRCRLQFLRVLDALATDPTANIDHVELLAEEDRQQILSAARGPEPAGAAPDFVQRFQSWAAERPGAIAAVGPEGTYTYQVLDALTDALAGRLRDLGVGPESRVGVALPRGVRELSTIIATLKAGGCYVPMDLEHPVDRLRVIFEDAAPEVLVSTSGALLKTAMAPDSKFLALDDLDKMAANYYGGFVASSPNEDQLAYILFTSGSTGRPKGVEIPRGALANFLRAMEEKPGLSAGDRLLAITTTTFDIAGLELFLPLWVGGTVVIPDRETATDARLLRKRLEKDQITVLQATPTTWRLLLEAGVQPPSYLRMFCGGEPMSRELADRLLVHGGELWNLYGPTETTVWSTVEQVDRDSAIITIGRPIDHTQVYVLDRDGKIVPPGVVGEIVIGGRGLARGYRGRPDLTQERFTPSLFGPPGARLYHTGDLGRLRDDNRFECLGRIDRQVKIRGFRIELGEIESVLRSDPGVKEVLVVTTTYGNSGPILCAYWLGEATREALYNRARSKLPMYMVPSAYVPVPIFPLTTSGKIDHKALPPPKTIETATSVIQLPRSETERRVAKIFTEVIGVSPIGIYQDFFEVGGTSVLVVRARERFLREFGIELPLSEFFKSPTVAAIAARLDRPLHAEDSKGCLIQLKPGHGRRAMFLIHDADGEVLLYRNLALRMPRDMAVYGVVPLASGRLPMVHITIEEMAAHYVKEIRACQPEGPYHLGGLCAGGVIAFEVARQLVDLGERVALLALIEAISPQAPIRSQLVTKARLQRTIELLTSFRSLGFLHVAGESSRRLANFIRYEAEDKSLNLLASSLVHLLRRHRKSGFAWPDWLPVPSTRDIYLRAAARYVPKPVANAHAILVRATEGMGGESPSIVLCANPDFGWQSVLGPSLVAIDSPGSHSTLLQEAAVDTVARHLLLALE